MHGPQEQNEPQPQIQHPTVQQLRATCPRPARTWPPVCSEASVPTDTRIEAKHMNLTRDYYSDQKYCAHCKKYVSYLMSLDRSYCIECGERVRLFSGNDWTEFNETITRQKPKGGRPRKGGRETA